MTRDPESFVTAARTLLGVPFVHQGRSHHGVDCVGLVVLAANSCGIDTSADITNYSRAPHGVLIPLLEAALVTVEGEPRLGDLLVFRFKHEPMHIGIWTGSTLIHTFATIGRVVEHGLDERWKALVVGAYRLREFA
jgi:cell wall-associated NlpC family hydrolase